MDVLDVSKPHACLQCDKRFRRRFDLSRHQSVHAEKVDLEPPSKRSKKEAEYYETDSSLDKDETSDSSSEVDLTSESEEDDSDLSEAASDLEDQVVYQQWLGEAKEDTAEIRNKQFQKYVNEGMTDDLAREKSNIKTLWAVKRSFFNKYRDFLSMYMHLKDDETFQDILADIEGKLDAGSTIHKAIIKVMPKHDAQFDGLFLQDEDSSDEEEEGETTD